MKHLGTIVLGVLLAGVGLAAGALLFAPHEHEAAKDGHAHEAAPPVPVLSPQARKNIGVRVAPAQRSDFVVTRAVQAVIVDRPLNLRQVTAAFGGIVVEVRADVGEVVRADDALIVLARDPIPRPSPDLTADLLAPLNEAVHDIAGDLRTAVAQAALAEQELDRIAPFVESRTIPRKTEIELRYDLERFRRQIENARMDLRLHGLTDEEIQAVEEGEHPPPSRQLWKRALAEAGLWSPVAERVYELLAEAGCASDLPWCVAAIGELAATGLATPELLAVLAESPSARVHFADVAGLLLHGTPLETVRVLAETGALEPRVLVRVPNGGPEDWDVVDVLVRVGQRIEAGGAIATIHDARRMWLRLEPVGREIGHVARALEGGEALRAVPLVEGSGPLLEGLHLTRMATHAEPGETGGRTYAEIANRALATANPERIRSWALRVGLRYLVEMPVRRMPGRFVLPFDAVTARGADRIVFLEDGDGFRVQEVHVEYETDRVVVIADDGSLFEGDPVVQHGAFALGLALNQGPEVTDPHGHTHD